MPAGSTGARAFPGCAAAAVAGALVLSGCATTAGPDGAPKSAWVIDSLAQRCMASVIGGAVIGGLVGAITGGGGRGVAAGATVGTAAGLGYCAVIVALDANDRARIREAQLQAAATDKPQVLAYRGTDGLPRNVITAPRGRVVVEAPPTGPVKVVRVVPPTEPVVATLPAGQQVCTVVVTSAAIETKGITDVPAQTICRDADGSMRPVIVAMAM